MRAAVVALALLSAMLAGGCQGGGSAAQGRLDAGIVVPEMDEESKRRCQPPQTIAVAGKPKLQIIGELGVALVACNRRRGNAVAFGDDVRRGLERMPKP